MSLLAEYDHSKNGPRVTLCEEETLVLGSKACPTCKTLDAILDTSGHAFDAVLGEEWVCTAVEYVVVACSCTV